MPLISKEMEDVFGNHIPTLPNCNPSSFQQNVECGRSLVGLVEKKVGMRERR